MNTCIDPLVPSLLEVLIFWGAVLLCVALVVTLVVLVLCNYCWRRRKYEQRDQLSRCGASDPLTFPCAANAHLVSFENVSQNTERRFTCTESIRIAAESREKHM